MVKLSENDYQSLNVVEAHQSCSGRSQSGRPARDATKISTFCGWGWEQPSSMDDGEWVCKGTAEAPNLRVALVEKTVMCQVAKECGMVRCDLSDDAMWMDATAAGPGRSVAGSRRGLSSTTRRRSPSLTLPSTSEHRLRASCLFSCW